MPHAQTKLDDYILDTLLRDLVGHDRKPAAFLVYLWLAGEQSRRRSTVTISYQELAENTGLSRSSTQTSVRWLLAAGCSRPRRPMRRQFLRTPCNFPGGVSNPFVT